MEKQYPKMKNEMFHVKHFLKIINNLFACAFL